jgi:hypothetical protein
MAMAPCTVGAQQRATEMELGRIVGQLVDAQTGMPVEGVSVRIVDLERPAQLSNAAGRFTFVDVPRGVYELEIRHLSYGTAKQLVNVPLGDVVNITARLRVAAIPLDSVVVTVYRRRTRLEEVGFLERRRRGFGYFFADEEADAWKIDQILAGIARVEVRWTSATNQKVFMSFAGRLCIPEIYVDGVLQRWAEGDVRLAIAGLDIAAVEVYRGTETPGEFQQSAYRPCGAIVIWRKF